MPVLASIADPGNGKAPGAADVLATRGAFDIPRSTWSCQNRIMLRPVAALLTSALVLSTFTAGLLYWNCNADGHESFYGTYVL